MTDTTTPPPADTTPFCQCGYRQSQHGGANPHACGRFTESNFFNRMVLPDGYTMDNKKTRRGRK